MRNIPVITKNLLIINLLAFLASIAMPAINDFGGLHFFLADDFHLYQFVSYMFLHSGFMHIFFNMFALWMFGCVIENVWGSRKFLFYYMSCGIGAGLMQEVAQLVQFYVMIEQQAPGIGFADLFRVADTLGGQLNGWTTIGASGSVYGILLAFGMTFPNERIFIFPLPVPIKAKWFVMFYAGLELFQALGQPGDGVAHMAHLGGMLIGFLMIRYWNNHPDIRYNPNGGRQFFDSLKNSFDRRRNSSGRGSSTGAGFGWRKGPGAGRGGAADTQRTSGTTGTRTGTDWEYNARKKANQDEIDRILDKIRKSGYDSLTKEEKQKLFDNKDN